MVVVVLVVAVVVDATNSFITASKSSHQAFKTATLLKTLSVNSLIFGESGVGKKTLAQYILPNAEVIDASNHEELLFKLQSLSEVLIINLHNSPNIDRLIELLKQRPIRVIATSQNHLLNSSIDDIFSVKFDIPPLRERPQDVDKLVSMFVKEVSFLFGIESRFETKDFTPDLSKNSESLKRQIMIEVLFQDIKDFELMKITQNYLKSNMGSQDDYKNFLYLYEVPLIKAGLIKFKSQSNLSIKLGLNRNTLRKKISQHKKYF